MKSRLPVIILLFLRIFSVDAMVPSGQGAAFWKLEANLQYEWGNDDMALIFWEKAEKSYLIENKPDSAEWCKYQQAWILLQNLNLNKAKFILFPKANKKENRKLVLPIWNKTLQGYYYFLNGELEKSSEILAGIDTSLLNKKLMPSLLYQTLLCKIMREKLENGKSVLLFKKLLKANTSVREKIWLELELGCSFKISKDSGEAQASFQDAFGMLNNLNNKKYPEWGNYYFCLAQFNKSFRRIIQAEENAQKALSFFQANSNMAKAARTWYLLGSLSFINQKMEEGINRFQKAESLYAREFGNENLFVARCENSLGNLYEYYEKPNLALASHKKVLAIREKILGQNSLGVAATLDNIGNALSSLGRNAEALEMQERSLKIFELKLGQNSADVAILLNNIGCTLEAMGRLSEALEKKKESIKIKLVLKDQFGPEIIAFSYFGIGMTLESLGRSEEAISYKQLALSTALGCLPNNHPDVGRYYNSLAISQQSLGLYYEALSGFKKAVGIFIGSNEEYDFKAAGCYNNIGNLLEILGRYNEAKDYFDRGLVINKKVYGENHPNYAINLDNIAKIIQTTGKYEEALDLHLKAINILLVSEKEANLDLARSYLNAGECLINMYRYDEALELQQKALNIYLRIRGRNNSKTGICHFLMGKSYCSQGKFMKALENFKISGQIFKEWLGPNHENYIRNNLKLALVYRKLNKPDSCIFYSTLALEAIMKKDNLAVKSKYNICSEVISAWLENMKYFSATGPYSTETLFRKALFCNRENQVILLRDADRIIGSKAHHGLAELTLNWYFSKNIGVNAKVDSVLPYLESAKSSSLVLKENERDAIKISGIPDSVWQLERKYENARYALENSLENRNLDSQNMAYQDFKARQLFTIQSKLDSLRENLYYKYPKYAALKQMQDAPTRKSITEALIKHKAIISYFISDSSVYGLYFSKTGTDLYKMPATGKKVEAWVKGFRNTAELKLDVQPFSDSLAQVLIAPLKEKLDNNQINNLVIIPDGILYFLPFEALLYRNKKSKNPEWLVNSYAISYHLSIGKWLEGIQKKSGNKTGEIIAFAPVNKFSHKLELLGYHADSLPASAEEVQNLVPNTKSKIYSEASEYNFRKLNNKEYRYIHLATHGLIDPYQANNTGIVLSNDTTGGYDGILNASDFYGFNIPADLITLSACETGKGPLAVGDGVIGFNRALFFAGARSTLVSQWIVIDQSTALLMKDFYAGMNKNTSKSEALRKAKLKLMLKYPHPFYWAPFVLTGND